MVDHGERPREKNKKVKFAFISWNAYIVMQILFHNAFIDMECL